MFEYQESIDIHRPAGEVFAYLIKAENFPEWVDTTVEAWQVTEGPVAVGTRQSEIVTLGFLESRVRNQLNWEVVEYEEGRRVTFESYTGIGYQKQSFTFEPTERGTRLQVNGTHRLQGPIRLAQPIMRFFVERSRREHLMNLKQILESGRQE
jgi:uncharacterized membrane protein